MAKTFVWFTEEIGEMARAIRNQDQNHLREEAADIFAWLCTICNLAEIDLEEEVLAKYGKGCPRCGKKPCKCKEAFK